MVIDVVGFVNLGKIGLYGLLYIDIVCIIGVCEGGGYVDCDCGVGNVGVVCLIEGGKNKCINGG